MIKKYLMLLLFLPVMAFAAAPAWKIVPKDSNITFTATQNGAPVTGLFKNFTGDINFDPSQLSTSNVKIVIDVSSISDAYNQLADTLKGKDWFDATTYPQATFKSSEFTKTGDKTYQVKGTLTIRDKTLPTTLNVTQEEYSATKAVMKGTTTIKRTSFGVGQGEWADTKAIKDDVKIDFTITAQK